MSVRFPPRCLSEAHRANLDTDSAVPADAWATFKRCAMGEGGLPCPDCVAAAAGQGRVFDGGYLHPSREYGYLLHCNCCGAYYARVSHVAPLRHVSRAELAEHQEVNDGR